MSFKKYYILSESIQKIIDLADELHLYTTEEINAMMKDWNDGFSTPRDTLVDTYELREKFVQKFGWSIPCKDAIDTIKEYNQDDLLVDIMAGTGYWTALMKKAGGIDVEAYDILPGVGLMKSKKKGKAEVYDMKGIYGDTQVTKKDALDTIKDINGWMDENNRKANIFMSWPPGDMPVAFEIAANMKPGTLLFYIGEGSHGCTGCEKLHGYLSTEFTELAFVEIPQFSMVHDYLIVYLKKDIFGLRDRKHRPPIEGL